MENKKLRWLSNIVIGYMIIALTWWTVLLFVKNRDAFEAKAAILRIGMAAERTYIDEQTFLKDPKYTELDKQYHRQEIMVLGAAATLIVTCVIGVWMINRGYHRQMQASEQSRNFLLSITHELKSPLASIQLVLDTFRKRELNREQIEKLTGNGLKETERLIKLVNNLLLAAKVENKYEPVLEDFDVKDLITELIFNLQQKYQNALFHFKIQTPETSITADKQGFESVLLNLMENAVKYSNETPFLDIELSKKGNNLIISVADQGIGIADSDKKLIFERFYRVGSEDTRQTKGTGLGLYIVKEIIKAHHGKVLVANNFPKGSIFKITLPFKTHLKSI